MMRSLLIPSCDPMDLCSAVLVRSLGQALTGNIDQQANASDREQSETTAGEISLKCHWGSLGCFGASEGVFSHLVRAAP